MRRLGIITRRQPTLPKVTPNEIAYTLLLNGKSPKTNRKVQEKRIVRESCKETDYLSKKFGYLELQKAIDAMKEYKAAGLDDICTEQLHHLGSGARK